MSDDSNGLYRVVYVSHNVIAGGDDAQRREIDRILDVAQHHNQAHHITGALLFNAGCFAQVLEGAHDDIQALFERIACDPRHEQVTVLDFDPLEARHFGGWAMAYHGCHTPAAERFADVALRSGFAARALDGDQLQGLLLEHLNSADGG